MKQIPVYKNYHLADLVQVDDDDFERLERYKWQVADSGYTKYAYRVVRANGKATTILMHREILGLSPKDGKIVDHKDRNGLNNQKSNIWVCTARDNALNSSQSLGGRRNSINHQTGFRIGDPVTLDRIEEEHIKMVLSACPTFEKAAVILGIEPSTLWRKRVRYKILDGSEKVASRS
jgi:DNA-binding protein Fis